MAGYYKIFLVLIIYFIRIRFFSACSRLGAWDKIASAGPELVDGGLGGYNGPVLSKKRIPISLAALAQPSIQSNFPVLVRLQPSVFPYADCRSDGLDIRFRASDGTELAFERDSWNKGGISDFWVKIPNLAVFPQDARIWIYFGDSTATDGSNAAEVWTNGYLAVLHGSYTVAAGERYYHNSVGSNDPDTVGSFDPPGDLANASILGNYGFRFGFMSNGKDGIRFPASAVFNDLGPIVFETWMRDQGTAANGLLFYKGGNSLASIPTSGTIHLYVGHATAALSYDSSTNFFINGWKHLLIAWNGLPNPFSALSMYFDGVSVSLVGTGPSGTRTSDAGGRLVIGNDSSPAPPYEGLNADLDEIRISNVERSADWVKAQYLSQLGNKLVFGDVEDVPE